MCFAAEADDQVEFAAEVGVEAEVSEGADRNFGAGGVEWRPATVVVGDGDDVIDVGITR